MVGYPFGERSEQKKSLTDQVNQQSHLHYGWPGYRMIDCLTNKDSEFTWEWARSYWKMWQDRYIKGTGDEYRLRMARAPALIQMARNIGEKFLGLPELDTDQSDKLDRLMIRSMDGAIAHLDRVANFKNRLQSMLASSSNRFYAPIMGTSAFAQGGRPSWYGFYGLYQDTPTVCFIITEIKKYFEDAGVMEWRARFEDLAKNNMCVLSDAGSASVQRRPFKNGPRPLVYQVILSELGMDVDRSVFEEQSGEDELQGYRHKSKQYS
jgi:hypothetical protein